MVDVVEHISKNDVNTVYIGFKKPHSKWYKPDIKCLKDYKEYIKTNCNILELDNCVLQCHCNFWKKCHGHILVFLLLEKKGTTMDIISFNLDDSPFSNSYVFPFVYCEYSFFSLAHAYYWEKSGRNSTILKCENLKSAAAKFKDCKKKNLALKETIQLFYNLLCEKYQQCLEFKELINKHKNDFILQNTSSRFWGKGDISQCTLSTQNGQNIAGWLLMMLWNENKNFYRKKLIFLNEGIVNAPLINGLKLVMQSLERN